MTEDSERPPLVVGTSDIFPDPIVILLDGVMRLPVDVTSRGVIDVLPWTDRNCDEGEPAVPVTITPAPFEDIATTSADIVDVTVDEPARTVAVFAPEMIEIAPDETDVIVGFDDRITVGLEDRITVGLLDSVTVALVSVT